MILTQHVSCVFSSFMNATRCITVWIVSVILGMETCQPVSTSLQIIGFVFLVLGNLIYNEVLVIKFMGLNSDIKKVSKPLKKSRLQINKEKLELRKKQTETELKNNPMLSLADSFSENSFPKNASLNL